MRKGNEKEPKEKRKAMKYVWLGRLITVGLTLVILGAFTLGLSFQSGAFGDYNDYDYDSGGSDWGSSDWGDSDWGSSDWDDNDYGGGGGGGGSLSDIVSIINLILFFVPPKYRCCAFIILAAAIVLFNTVRKMSKSGKGGNVKNNSVPGKSGQAIASQKTQTKKQAPLVPLNIPNRDVEIGTIITERDPHFTSPDFIAFAKNVYMNIQDAWCNRDLEPVRPILHQNLYERTEKQIQKKIADGIVQHLDRLTVNEAYITAYRRDTQLEYVKVYLNSSMIDYQVKEATGEILYGDRTTRWTMRYEMTFMRSVAAKTPEAGAQSNGINCPNCGAPLKGTSFGKCPYCDSLVTTGLYSWVLSDFNAIKNSFNDEGIRVQDGN